MDVECRTSTEEGGTLPPKNYTDHAIVMRIWFQCDESVPECRQPRNKKGHRHPEYQVLSDSRNLVRASMPLFYHLSALEHQTLATRSSNKLP